MAEVLREFDDVVVDRRGVGYHVHACGTEAANGLWEGWLEFVPLDGSRALRSGRETTQPNHEGVRYWAEGLSSVYAEGALQRAQNPTVLVPPTRGAPRFDGPAPARSPEPTAPDRDAVLNPFSVYEKGESLLRRQLSALSAWHLVGIIEAYDLRSEPMPVLNRLPASALVELIVESVRRALPR